MRAKKEEGLLPASVQDFFCVAFCFLTATVFLLAGYACGEVISEAAGQQLYSVGVADDTVKKARFMLPERPLHHSLL